MIAFLLAGLGLLSSAFFSAVETAVVSANRARLSHRADEGDLRAGRALRATDDRRRVLGATLVGNSLANVFTTTLVTLYFEHRFGEAVVPFVVVALTAVLLVFGEMIPKTLARAQADAWTVRFAGVLESVDAALRPLVSAVTNVSSALLHLFGVRAQASPGALSRQEFQILLDETEESGLVAPAQGRILSRVMDFGETQVAQVMRPRTEVAAVELGTRVRDAIGIVAETGYTRLPAYRDHPDQIVGLVHLYDLFRAPSVDLPVDGLLRPVAFVPGAKRCDELLREMRARHRPLAVVVDEYGGTAGIVTLEDLVEVLVGDIKNEGEGGHVPLRRVDATRWAADASMRVAEINEALDFDLPEGDYETLGGLVLERLGRIPSAGEIVHVAGVRIEVLSADRRRIRSLAVARDRRTRRSLA